MSDGDRRGEVQLVKVKIRPGRTGELVGFLRSLGDRDTEVQRSLALEGIIAESLFVERTDEDDWLYFFTRARNLEHAAEAFASSELPLDVETRRVIAETWGEVTQIEPVADLVARPGWAP